MRQLYTLMTAGTYRNLCTKSVIHSTLDGAPQKIPEFRLTPAAVLYWCHHGSRPVLLPIRAKFSYPAAQSSPNVMRWTENQSAAASGILYTSPQSSLPCPWAMHLTSSPENAAGRNYILYRILSTCDEWSLWKWNDMLNLTHSRIWYRTYFETKIIWDGHYKLLYEMDFIMYDVSLNINFKKLIKKIFKKIYW